MAKGHENMKSLAERTTDEQREIAKKGGKASGEARRRKKTMKESLEVLLSMGIEAGKIIDVEDLEAFPQLKGKNITVNDAIMVKQVQKALKGDQKAAEFVRDSIGQKPDTAMKLGLDIPVLFAGEDKLEDE